MYLLFAYKYDNFINDTDQNFAGKFNTLQKCLSYMTKSNYDKHNIYDSSKDEWYEFNIYYGELLLKTSKHNWIHLDDYNDAARYLRPDSSYNCLSKVFCTQ